MSQEKNDQNITVQETEPAQVHHIYYVLISTKHFNTYNKLN
jgi:hypothetical protein